MIAEESSNEISSFEGDPNNKAYKLKTPDDKLFRVTRIKGTDNNEYVVMLCDSKHFLRTSRGIANVDTLLNAPHLRTSKVLTLEVLGRSGLSQV